MFMLDVERVRGDFSLHGRAHRHLLVISSPYLMGLHGLQSLCACVCVSCARVIYTFTAHNPCLSEHVTWNLLVYVK